MYLLFVVAPIVCVGLVLVPCFVLQYVVSISFFAIISLGRRELVDLLLLCLECHVAVIVLWLFLAEP